MDLIALVIIWLFRLSNSSWANFGKLYLLKTYPFHLWFQMSWHKFFYNNFHYNLNLFYIWNYTSFLIPIIFHLYSFSFLKLTLPAVFLFSWYFQRIDLAFWSFLLYVCFLILYGLLFVNSYIMALFWFILSFFFCLSLVLNSFILRFCPSLYIHTNL